MLTREVRLDTACAAWSGCCGLLHRSGCSWRGGGDPLHQTLSGTWIIAEDVNGAIRIEVNQNVYYEIFVRAFADSDGDGIGDLRGVVNMLDYLNDGDPDDNGGSWGQRHLADADSPFSELSRV